jgi:hypothetical protein
LPEPPEDRLPEDLDVLPPDDLLPELPLDFEPLLLLAELFDELLRALLLEDFLDGVVEFLELLEELFFTVVLLLFELEGVDLFVRVSRTFDSLLPDWDRNRRSISELMFLLPVLRLVEEPAAFSLDPLLLRSERFITSL